MFRFPNLASIELALRSGMVPVGVADSPLVAVFEPGGAVRVEPLRALSRWATAALSKIGVSACDRRDLPELPREPLLCWPQLVPVVPERSTEAVGPTTPVLFDLPGPLLPELTGEILRLGNDRQGLRWLSKGGNAPPRALLRVVGPPYFTLLRAIERGDLADVGAPRAYLEQSRGVWVEVGYRHSWADRLRPPQGKLILIGPPGRWEFLDDEPFRDLYEVAEFKLPAPASPWRDIEPEAKISVPLRLARGGSTDPAGLWVIDANATDQLDALARHSDDQLLSRLAFAVALPNGEGSRPAVVLRARPSKLPPPILVLDAKGYRAYMRLPNLFLPEGHRLHPPLRRDAVARLLAADPARLTWLSPTGQGSFTPLSLPDDAFLPFDRWVDYVLDREHQALDAWVKSSRFDFASFLCHDDGERPEGPKRDRARAKGQKARERPAEATKGPSLAERAEARKSRLTAAEADTPAIVEPGEAVRLLSALESQFHEMEGPLDDPRRVPVWAEMATLNVALDRHSDAAVCWANAHWEVDEPPANWLVDWFLAERKISGRRLDEPTVLDALLDEPGPTVSETRALTTLLLTASEGAHKSLEGVISRIGKVQMFLERNENDVPVRVAWLAWSAVAKLSGGDVLTLARARDRILERLHHQGLNRDVDLPSFLRYRSGAEGDRARMAREQLARLHPMARSWVDRGLWPAPHTGALCDLMFATGLARIGDTRGSVSLLESGLGALRKDDPVTAWLARAFDHRVRQALEGNAAAGPLPDDLMSLLDNMGKDGTEAERKQGKHLRYKIDRLREHSNILEPHEKVSPYRHWRGAVDDEVSRTLARVVDLTDRDEMTRTMERLLALRPVGPKPWIRASQILGTALEVAYRLGEPFARGLFNRVLPTVEGLDQLGGRARLLERAVQLAAHFDQPGHVRSYVARFEVLLDSATERDHGELEPLLRECFRGLRKLGVRDEIDRLLGKIAKTVLRGRGLSGVEELKGASVPLDKGDSAWARSLLILLQVAAGWCYFGQPDRALPIFEEARSVILGGKLFPIDQTILTCSYARSLGQAPAAVALPRLEELFTKVERVHDTFTVGSHYSLSRLDLIEAVVLTLSGEDFTLGESGRRWVEDDEYLVRRRIHRDVRAALGEHN